MSPTRKDDVALAPGEAPVSIPHGTEDMAPVSAMPALDVFAAAVFALELPDA